MREKILLEEDFALTSNSPNDRRTTRRWGFISALPSEYLIHFRKGKILESSSGQAATCFKRLRDTVFIIPTSLKEIVFEANQLTSDNVDVRIRGMALYRIREPMKIYKLLNFSDRQRAEAKLARMIADMCRSTAKWLVANMGVEECIRKRKEEIAESLRKEVSRVVADEESGWGVEIGTIDIQDVYIQDEEIFMAMQMLFKADKMRESKLAELAMERELELRRLENERSLGDQRKTTRLEKARIDAEIKEEQIRLTRQSDEKQFALDRYRVEQNAELADYKLTQEMEQERRRMALSLDQKKQEVETQKLHRLEEIEALRARIEVENTASPLSLERSFLEHALPEIAQTIASNMKDARMTIYQQDGQGGTPFHFVLSEIMELLRERLAPHSPEEKE